MISGGLGRFLSTLYILQAMHQLLGEWVSLGIEGRDNDFGFILSSLIELGKMGIRISRMILCSKIMHKVPLHLVMQGQ